MSKYDEAYGQTVVYRPEPYPYTVWVNDIANESFNDLEEAKLLADNLQKWNPNSVVVVTKDKQGE